MRSCLLIFQPRFALLSKITILLMLFLVNQTVFTQTEKGKTPVIVIPAITGSELINRETGKTAWFTFDFGRDEPDDLRLPISPNLKINTDTLVAKDIIRKVQLPGILKILPKYGVYGNALEALEARGYARADWDNPRESDVYYVFAYDWRHDNVKSARLLMDKMEAVKARLNRPDLKFNLVTHSMGGLIARYAAMYGRADLPTTNRAPALTWAGARHINKILLFGVPNEGTFGAFETLIHGYSVAGGKLPFAPDLGPDEIFSIPSVYQMLPNTLAGGFLDENLQPMRIDIYDPGNWRKYNWGAISNPKFLGKLKDAATIPGIKPVDWKIKNNDDKILANTTYQQATAFLAAVLNRAKGFQKALNVSITESPVEILAYGSECEPTLNAVVLVFDAKKKTWRTLTEAEKLKTAGGREIPKQDMIKAMFTKGDGRITRSSFLPLTAGGNSAGKPLFPVKTTFFVCVAHDKLLNNEAIQNNYLGVLVAETRLPPVGVK
jgi:pimeloyl-ACP methyl ester carboxylesterase